jgi:putative PIN family toxin of toxin-antitoxin system
LRLRVVLDVNVLISYLLGSTERQTTVGAVVRAALSGRFDLLLPFGLIDELIEAVATKRTLSRVIDLQDARAFASALLAIGEVLASPARPEAPVSRDPDDDYVYLSARQSGADYLVTGDEDLLALADQSSPLRIVRPAEFLRILQHAGLA